MIGSAVTIRSPSTTIRSRSTPCVAGCCGPMLSTMSAVARPPAPTPTVRAWREGDDEAVVSVMRPSLRPARRAYAACLLAAHRSPLLDRVTRRGAQLDRELDDG